MKFRRDNPGENAAETRLTSSEEMRELAEAVSLYRSAMHHVAEKQAAQPFVPAHRHATSLRTRLVLVPALGAALAAAVIAPVYVHLHHAAIASGQHPPQTPPPTVASVDDTELMNQIDSDLSQGVPDALQPLTGWDDTSTSAKKTTGTEK
jgi:hypothetical protein